MNKLIAVSIAICLVALVFAGASLWQLSHKRAEDIRCLRATIALIMDARVEIDRQTSPELGERSAATVARLKAELLEPRDCSSVADLSGQ